MNIFKNASSTRPTVALLSGEIFFIQRVELPEGMSDADVFSFVQITLEHSSPFPIEQLAWGFLQDPNGKGVLLYSTTHERLKRFQPDNLTDLYHVFPSFISPCMQVWNEPTALCLLQGNTLSALYFAANDPIPSIVINQAVPQNTDRSVFELAFAMRDALLSNFKHLNPAYEAGILLGTEPTVNKNGDSEFHHKHYRDLNPEAAQILEHTTLERSKVRWNADIRDTAFKNSENKKRLTNRRLQLGLYAAGVIFLCIIAAHIFRFGAKYYNYRLSTTATSQSSHVRKIEDDAALLTRLNQLAEKQFMPFAMLGVLNTTRPSGIYFENIKADPVTGFEVHGISSSVSQVNEYVSSLEHSEVIEDIKLADIQTRRGKVNFTLIANFDFTSIPASEIETLHAPIQSKVETDTKSTAPEKVTPAKQQPNATKFTNLLAESKTEANNTLINKNTPTATISSETPATAEIKTEKEPASLTNSSTNSPATSPLSSPTKQISTPAIDPTHTKTTPPTIPPTPYNPPIAQPNTQKQTYNRTPTQPHIQTRARTFSASEETETSKAPTPPELVSPLLIPEDELSE